MTPNTRTRNHLLVALIAICAIALVTQFVSASAITAPPQDGFIPKTVFLIRHAEKADAPRQDPPLNEAGKARAQELAWMFEGSGIKTIITSQFLRAKQTAEPLAKKLGLSVTPMAIAMSPANPQQVSEQSIAEIVRQVNEKPGEAVLVIGHSNTVPEVIRTLGGDVVPTIDEKKFDDLFVVTVFGPKKAKVVQMKYGAFDHAPLDDRRKPSPVL